MVVALEPRLALRQRLVVIQHSELLYLQRAVVSLERGAAGLSAAETQQSTPLLFRYSQRVADKELEQAGKGQRQALQLRQHSVGPVDTATLAAVAVAAE